MEEWVGLHISTQMARLDIRQVLSGGSNMGPKAPLKTNRKKEITGNSSLVLSSR